MTTSRRMHRPDGLRAALLLAPLALLSAVALVPEGRLTCSDPEDREASPDGDWTLTLCRRPMWFAMPGGASDAPGWVVLRDRDDRIRGVTGLSMVQLYSGKTVWHPDRVERPLVTAMPLPRTDHVWLAWLDDRLWRLRAWLGLVQTDDAFH